VAKIKPTEADEIEVKFSLKSTGELGNFAVGSLGVEAAYEVTLKRLTYYVRSWGVGLSLRSKRRDSQIGHLALP
jgi:hypothetical protein